MSNHLGDELRATFVEMLFALAAAEVAVVSADLVMVDAEWQSKLPALAHLAVAMFLIAASWLGWNNSLSPGKLEKIQSIFSIAFLGLLLDVALVILYFIVVRRVEIVDKGSGFQLAKPSAEPEAKWIATIFVVYAVWDLVTDLLSPGCINVGSISQWPLKAFRVAIVSAFTSAACLAMTCVLLRNAWHSTQPHQVILLDVGLVAVIGFFRVLKASENVLAPLFRVDDCKAFKGGRQTQGNEIKWGTILLGIYAAVVWATFS